MGNELVQIRFYWLRRKDTTQTGWEDGDHEDWRDSLEGMAKPCGTFPTCTHSGTCMPREFLSEFSSAFGPISMWQVRIPYFSWFLLLHTTWTSCGASPPWASSSPDSTEPYKSNVYGHVTTAWHFFQPDSRETVVRSWPDDGLVPLGSHRVPPCSRLWHLTLDLSVQRRQGGTGKLAAGVPPQNFRTQIFLYECCWILIFTEKSLQNTLLTLPCFIKPFISDKSNIL